MQRRALVLTAAALPAAALAHHGWSSFDQDRPIWLEGQVTKALWRNPHVTLEVQVAFGLALPKDLASRSVPAQAAPVDGKALLARATLPRRQDRRWEVELAPLTRVEAWKIPQIQPGAAVGLLGFTLQDERGEPVLRAEYLFFEGRVYGLRSSPA